MLPGSVMEKVTPVTGCADVQPAAAAVLLALGAIVGVAWPPAMSVDTVDVCVGALEAPDAQYRRNNACVVPVCTVT